MLPRSRSWVVGALACALCLIASLPAAAEEGQQGAVWDLGTQLAGARRATTVSAVNVSCRGKRDFEIEIEGQASRFLQITGSTLLEKIGRGETRTTPAVLDLNGVPAGVYNEGAIVVRCINCPANCRQDYTRIAVHLTVTAPGDSSAPGTAAATATDPDNSTRERQPCPEDTSSCDELKARADEARDAAAAARRAAVEAERNRQYDQGDAEWTDEDLDRDLEYARTLRRQAADWRELADNARADAAVNRDRANQWPLGNEYRDSWEEASSRDEARALERDARADRLEKEAEKLEAPVDERRDAAEELRTRADRLRAEADAKERAAEDAQAAYEACLNRLKEDCENRRLQEKLAVLARIAAESRARDAASDGSGSPGTDPDVEDDDDPGRAFLPGYESVVPRLSPFCKWATYEIPREAILTNVRLIASSDRDDTSALEIRRTAAAGTTIGFHYHCKKKTGSAVVAFTQSSGNNAKRYKLRIGCTPE